MTESAVLESNVFTIPLSSAMYSPIVVPSSTDPTTIDTNQINNFFPSVNSSFALELLIERDSVTFDTVQLGTVAFTLDNYYFLSSSITGDVSGGKYTNVSVSEMIPVPDSGTSAGNNGYITVGNVAIVDAGTVITLDSSNKYSNEISIDNSANDSKSFNIENPLLGGTHMFLDNYQIEIYDNFYQLYKVVPVPSSTGSSTTYTCVTYHTITLDPNIPPFTITALTDYYVTNNYVVLSNIFVSSLATTLNISPSTRIQFKIV